MVTGMLAARVGFPIPDESRRVGHIDGLRGYLALLVMSTHFSIWTMMTRGGGWQVAPSPLLNNFGVLCVMIFFMITGFLFFGKVSGGIRATDWKQLYISRLFRILPLSGVVVVTASLIALIMQSFVIGDSWITYPLRAGAWFLSYEQPTLFGYGDTALINALVLWSIRYEWTFYFLSLPLIALALGWAPFARRPWIVGLAMIGIGIGAHVLHPQPLFLDSMQAFGFGALARVVITRGAPGFLKSSQTAFLALTFLICVYAFTDNPLNPAVMAVLAFFFLCVAAGNPFFGLFTNRGALVLGESSFSIYMLHGIVLFVGFKIFWPTLTKMSLAQIIWLYPLFAFAAALISMTSYRLIERPGIALGRTFSRRLKDSRTLAG
jgi:peptidoglycan/LPS O-acetylase OafA/YrhL